jgi:hypothetical protein
MGRPKLKIYGERNTGTNYLVKLVGLNLDVDQLPGVVPKAVYRLQEFLPGRDFVRDAYFALTFGKNLGWKHTLVQSDAIASSLNGSSGRTSVVTITKNPYSWLLSMYKRPYNKVAGVRPSLEDFIQTPWRTVGRENAPAAFADPIELWNAKNAAYLGLQGAVPALNTRYEDILEDPAAVIEEIARAFSLERKSDHFQDYTESTKDSDKDSNYYRDYYLNERWRHKLTPRAIALVNERLDGRLMDRFGYAWLADRDAATPRASAPR